LLAPIVNGGGDTFWKWMDFQLWRTRDLDLGSGHTAYRRASFFDLYVHAKFHWNRSNFLWTDVRTHVRTHGQTDGHLRPALLGGLWRFNLKTTHADNSLTTSGCVYHGYHQLTPTYLLSLATLTQVSVIDVITNPREPSTQGCILCLSREMWTCSLPCWPLLLNLHQSATSAKYHKQARYIMASLLHILEMCWHFQTRFHMPCVV